jgi:hypothetical protein
MRVRAMAAIIVTALSVCGTAASAEWFRHEDRFYPREELDAYARAVGLRQLTANSPDSLRIWSADVMSGTLWGSVASRGTTLECQTRYDWWPRGTSDKTGHCRVTKSRTNSAEALKFLPDLAKLDKQQIDCGVQDGESVLVEGVVGGQVFAFYSGNPGSCTDAASALVVRVRRFLLPASGHAS